MKFPRLSIEVLQRNERWLKKLAYDLTHDAGAAEDLVQDTFLAVLRKPPPQMNDGESNPARAYLSGVLRNLYKMEVRASVRRERREALSGTTQGAPRPDFVLDERWAQRTLLNEVDGMAEPFRSTLLLRYYEGLHPNEIAARLGIPAATVRKRNQLALERLRKRLDAHVAGDRMAWLQAVTRMAAPPAWLHKFAPSKALRSATTSVAIAVGVALVAHWSPIHFPGGAKASSMNAGQSQTQGTPASLAERQAKRESFNAPIDPAAPANTEGEAPEAVPDDEDSDASDTTAMVSHGATRCGTLQSKLEQAPAGARIVLPAGCIYREKALVLKPVSLVAEPGVQVRGSDLWTRFERQDALWVSVLSVPVFPDHGRDCQRRTPGPCTGPEQVYQDGKPLVHVAAGTPLHPGQFTLNTKRQVLLASDPRAHEIEVTTRLGWMSVATHDVLLDGFTMKHAASPLYGLAVINPSERVTIRNGHFSDVAGTCVSLAGESHVFENNEVHHCGTEALRLEPGHAAIVRNNVLHEGGLQRSHIEWDAGGVAVVLHEGATLTKNRIYNNRGMGIFNISGPGLSVVQNEIHGNAGAGIAFLRAKRGEVRDNSVWSNGHEAQPPEPGLCLTSSSHVEVANNTFAFHPFAMLLGPMRGALTPGFEPCHDTANNRVHDNVFVANRRGSHHLVISGDPREDALVPSCSSNRVEANHFWPAAETAVGFSLSAYEKDRWLAQRSMPLE